MGTRRHNSSSGKRAATPRPHAEFPIVGVGASAGGLEALEGLLRNAAPDSGMAYVMVTHQHPDHVTLLPELLQRHTAMPVKLVEERTPVEPNHVYVSPPGKQLSIARGVLDVAAPNKAKLHLPIDHFFRSLAVDQKERAVCIILSGTGSDGTLGLRAVKGEGGMAMVQDGDTAKYAAMPRSGEATGLADYVLPPSEMPAQLLRYARGLRSRPTAEAPDEPALAELQPIFVLLRGRTGHDFSSYSQLLTFSRKRELVPSVFELDEVLENSEALLRHLVGEDVRLHVQLGAPDSSILCDEAQVEQILMNLTANARDAMPKGGELFIETSDLNLADHPELPPGRYVCLLVRDTGTGMDAETRGKIFEPFFTTKRVGEGTGLGLAAVYGIVKQSGGHIEVESEPGRGTTFRVLLLRVQPAPRPAAPTRAVSGHGESILVIEDEALVRESVRHQLEIARYRVIEATDTDEARDLFRRNVDSIDLVLTDMVLPGIPVQQLVQEMQAQNTHLPVIYMSAYPQETLIRQGRLEPGTVPLHKPFTGNELLARIRAELEAVARGLEEPEELPRSERPEGERPTVLLVEDDRDSLDILRQCLEDAGLSVLAAANGKTALELARQAPRRIDVVLSDIRLPDFPGPQLVAELEKSQPGLEVVFMSGFSPQDTLVKRVLERPRTHFMQKPFDLDDAVERIRALTGLPKKR